MSALHPILVMLTLTVRTLLDPMYAHANQAIPETERLAAVR